MQNFSQFVEKRDEGKGMNLFEMKLERKSLQGIG
jgi:hypothetical protein